MKLNNQSTFTNNLFFYRVINAFILGIILLVLHPITLYASNDAEDTKTIRGEVENTLIVKMSNGVIVMILKLSDKKKYRLNPGITPGIGKKFNIELIVPTKFEPIKDEVWIDHPNATPVISAKITAIPIPGRSDKLVYPPTNPPRVIKGTK